MKGVGLSPSFSFIVDNCVDNSKVIHSFLYLRSLQLRLLWKNEGFSVVCL